MQTYEQQITALYVGYFNRAPDAEGLAYWLGKANSGVAMREIAASFISSPEAIRNYPDLRDGIIDSPDNFITTVYRFAFDRYPDAGGATYWLSKIQAGTPVKDAMYDILFTASGFDELRLNNKVEVGIYYAKQTGSGKFDAGKANSFVDHVDATSGSVAKAKADIDTYLNPPVIEPDPNIAPVAADDNYTTIGGGTLTVNTSIGVLANDTDVNGDALQALLVNNPSHGTLSLNADGSFSYTPGAGYTGTDTFTYQTSDGHASSNVATVNITVSNNAPVATDDNYTMVRNHILSISAPGILSNDTDADGHTLNSVIVTGPANGTLTLDPDGSFSYTPDNNFTGTDTFTYKASDGSANSNAATVTISVNNFFNLTAATNSLVGGFKTVDFVDGVDKIYITGLPALGPIRLWSDAIGSEAQLASYYLANNGASLSNGAGSTAYRHIAGNTFVYVDSNNDGILQTNGDVFFKINGIVTIDATDFSLTP